MEFSQIAILLAVAGVFGVFAKLLKQPLLVGYLFAGLFLGLTGVIGESQTLDSLSQIGVALLLFLLGLEMNLRELPTIGKVALLTGIGQITFTSLIGYSIARVLGFENLPSIYVAVALTFSSTIIMVKLLSEKKDLSSLYGKIAVGFLLVQDFVAVIILMFLAGLGRGNQSIADYGIIGIKAIILFALVWFLSHRILPRFFNKIIGGSTELLFIVSIAWALGAAAFVAGPMGFTLEIGGFLAGLALSNIPEHLQIASKTRPLRDFFLTIFFLLLGTKLVISGGILSVIFPALIFSTFVLVGNPIIVLAIMGAMRYKKRTSFLAGLTVAQISEFSLILMSMGLVLGHVSDSEVAMVILVGVITMTTSTYMILGADKLFKKVSKYLSVFERKQTKEAAYASKLKLSDHFVLVGCDRTGRPINKYFKRKELEFVVVDFDPSVFNKLTAKNTPVIFGDINDPEIFELADIENAKMVISTTDNLETNLTFIEQIKAAKNKLTTVFTVSTKDEAIKLYEKGATFVVVPEIVAGDYINHLLNIPGMGKKRLTKMGKSHFDRLLK